MLLSDPVGPQKHVPEVARHVRGGCAADPEFDMRLQSGIKVIGVTGGEEDNGLYR